MLAAQFAATEPAEVRRLCEVFDHGRRFWWRQAVASIAAWVAREQGDATLARRLVGEVLPAGLATESGNALYAPALAV